MRCCIICDAPTGTVWREGDGAKIPAPPSELYDTPVCVACYINPATLEQRVRDGMGGKKVSVHQSRAEYLYWTSDPAWKVPPRLQNATQEFQMCGFGGDWDQNMDNLLFILDARRLNFANALSILAATYPRREKLAMYRSFFERCYNHFRRHYNWIDMSCYRVDLA